MLVAHPAVADALVVGVPDETYGERVAVVVQPAAGPRRPLDDLQAHARDRLAGYKLPAPSQSSTVLQRAKGDYAWAKERASEQPDPGVVARPGSVFGETRFIAGCGRRQSSRCPTASASPRTGWRRPTGRSGRPSAARRR